MHDSVIIGGGHNGLVTAFYLARAGRKPLVLERRPIVGGCATSEEFAPGYRAATLAHTLGPIRPSIVRDMQLERRGVTFVHPDPRIVAFAEDGRALLMTADAPRTARNIVAFSSKDAAKFPEFCASLAKVGGFLRELLEMIPPSVDAPSKGELWELLKTGRRFRALGRRESFALLRWGPMAAADLVGEWFETDIVRATIAAPGIFGTFMGPWSAGSGAVLLLAAANDPQPGGSSVTAVGGPGAVTHAMAEAAREAGAEIRTGVDVARIDIRDGAVAGVVLSDGTEIPATVVVSGVDPKQTFLGLIDPIELEPGFLTRIRNYRVPGTAAKLNIALSALPSFRGLGDVDAAATLRGRVHVGPGIDYLERAFDASKYGEISEQPYLDVSFPTLTDPSMAPAGRHVMSVYMQYAPFTLRDGTTWESKRGTLASIVLRTLEAYAPGITALVEHQQVITPADLQHSYGLSGGHIFHGELALDQLFTMRPTLGWAQHRTPIHKLYLCGSGTHPGNGLTGGSGQNAAREILKHR
ncbi:MAG TPA: NAD(P)/FAD-dependent oxidoreductase [Vicinamibacterales bacterium]|jgi:phytoene dehydrogenase-like protein|nr:NAD(P)/FAD-dependent oxidoreductase [Vicinamibacterales bacterium]